MSANITAPVGVYDSGVGGIAILRALRSELPKESFVYVADSRHAPYGERDQSFLETRAKDILNFFAGHQVKAVVLACNTVSVAAAASLRSSFEVPIVAMEPAIKPAIQITRSGKVLVLATQYTTESRAVASLCERFGGAADVILQPCPGLVEQVESGAFSADKTFELLGAYVRPGVAAGADTIVLGCTHYSFLAEQVRLVAGPGVAIVDPSQAIAKQLKRRLGGCRVEVGPAAPQTTFYTSGSVERLRYFLDGMEEKSVCVWPMAGEAKSNITGCAPTDQRSHARNQEAQAG